MPKTNVNTKLETRLSHQDMQRITHMALEQKLPKSTLIREAIRWYLDNHEQLKHSERESKLEQRMKKLEDRLAKLQIKTAIDAGMIFLLMYRHMELNERDKAVAWAYSGSVTRLRKKLTESQSELTDLAKSND